MALRVGHDDLSDTVLANPWRIELDAGIDETSMDRVHVVDQEPNPGAEPARSGLPVRHGSVQPHLAVTCQQLDIADNTIVVGPTFTLGESEHLDAPVGNGTRIGAEHVRNDATDTRIFDHQPPILSLHPPVRVAPR